jgi:protein-disulfide isomerase
MIRNLLLITASALILTACGGGASNNKTAKGNTTAPATPTASKWLETASESPEGGFVLGNPDAKVKLIEYGSLGCGACAAFSADSHTELNEMVAKGNLSFEFRPYLVFQIQDVPPTLLARCNGPAAFFTILEKIYADQANWKTKMNTLTPEQQAAAQNAKPGQLSTILAESSGLIPFVQQLGVSSEKAKACVADEKAIQKLVDINNKGASEFKITGTPSFIINGKSEGSMSWPELKTKLVAAGA